MMMEGYAFFANRKLVTIFSCPCYQPNVPNSGAVLKVLTNGGIGLRIMKPDPESAETDEDYDPGPPSLALSSSFTPKNPRIFNSVTGPPSMPLSMMKRAAGADPKKK